VRRGENVARRARWLAGVFGGQFNPELVRLLPF
jgi:phage shock protein PspC (stress-responsive transcriptional regulator)